VATGGGALSFLLLPRAEVPASGFFFPFLICFYSNLLSSFFLFCLSRKTSVCLPKISSLPLLFQPLLSVVPSLFSFPSSLLFPSLPMLFFSGSPSLCSLWFLPSLSPFVPVFPFLPFFSSLFPSSSFFYLPSVPLFFLSFFSLMLFPSVFSFSFPSSGFLVPLLPLVFFSSSPLACSISPSGFYSQNCMRFFSDNKDVRDHYCSGNGWRL